jgi:prepilin-type N-terminal cleavage/methylation domain-containing protein
MSLTDARRGFVLLEAVVALAIIGLFAVALLAATGAQVRTSSKGAVLLNARALAQDRMMALRMLDYEALNDVPDSLEAGAFPPPFEQYTWTASVMPVKDEYDLYDIQVLVSFGTEAYPLRSLVHEPRPVADAGGGP